jgi:hypothetical protein
VARVSPVLPERSSAGPWGVLCRVAKFLVLCTCFYDIDLFCFVCEKRDFKKRWKKNFFAL